MGQRAVEPTFPPPGSGWMDGLVRALGPLQEFGRGLLVVDLADGRIVGTTAEVEALLGRDLPPDLAGLVESGAVAQPDLNRLRDRYRAWRALDDVEHPDTDSTYGWSDSLVIHTAGRDRTAVNLEIAIERRRSVDAEAALVTVWRDDDVAEPIEGGLVEQFPELWAVYDADFSLIAINAAVRDFGLDPAALLGTSIWMYGHPDDIPRTMPRLQDVRDGRIQVARYPVRIRAQHGRWLPVEVEARRLEFAGAMAILVHSRYVNDQRRDIEAGRLTPRQLELVDGLFDGLRVNQLAERHGLAVKTVRNHLAAAYRTLGVSGQVELLATHHRPDRTA